MMSGTVWLELKLFAQVMLLLLVGYGIFLVLAHFVWGDLQLGQPLIGAAVGVLR